MKTVLVDDDPTILQGLRCLIDWKGLGFDSVFLCDDALNALELCKRERPDVVMVDVRMPGMTGLELIEALRKVPLEYTHYIILSGYEDFSYAKQAIRLNVAEYLLKPVDAAELTRVLIGVASSIEEKRSPLYGTKPESWSRMYYAISRLIHGLAMDDDPRIGETFQSETPYRLLVLRRGGDLPARGATQDQEKLARSFGEDTIFPFLHQKDLLFVIMEPKQTRFFARESLKRCWPDAQVCISPPMTQMAGVGKLFRQMVCSMELNAFFEGEWPLIMTEETLARRDISSLVEARESAFLNNLRLAVERWDYGAMDAVLKEIDALIRRRETFARPEQIRKLLSNAIRDTALTAYERGQEEKEISSELLELSVAASTLSYRATLERFRACLYRLCYSDAGDMDSDTLIKNIKIYLQKNYASHTLSLAFIAETFHINACYLSSLFHRKTGTCLWNYVVAIRLEHAERLLRNSQQSIQSISQRTGFNSNKTFYKAFKERYGVTPTHWRKKAEPPEEGNELDAPSAFGGTVQTLGEE